MTGMVEESIVSQISGLSLRKSLRVRCSESVGKKGANASSGSEHPLVAAVQIKSQSRYRENMDDIWNEYAQTASPSCIVLHRRGTEGSKDGKVTVRSA